MILCIAIGNSLRGDDGVAHRVLELMDPHDDISRRNVMQLTPELAAEIAPAPKVLFIDADLSSAQPCIEPVSTTRRRHTTLAHTMTPEGVVTLAQHLYGFCGDAYLCRVPAANFDGEGLSSLAASSAHAAAETIRQFIHQPSPA